jgi:hypothetical protein
MQMKFRFYSLRLSCTLALCLPALILPARVGAQEVANDANAQYRKAFDALAQKDWPEARRLLLPLWQNAHTWDVASGLGQAEFLLQNYAAGATYTAFALANLPPKEKPKTAERLRAALSEMKEAVGTVRLAVNHDGAEILVENEVLGRSPLGRDVYLNPGTRLLQARLADGAQGRQTLEVEAGKSYQVALVVDQLAEPEVAGATQATAATGAFPPVRPDTGQRNWAPLLVTGSLAVAAAAIGTGFAIDASSAKTDGAKALTDAEAQFGENPCTPAKGGGSEICQSLTDAEDRRKSSSTVATISFVASGVFALAAVGSYFLWAKPGRPQLDAWLGADGGGLRLKGSF